MRVLGVVAGGRPIVAHTSLGGGTVMGHIAHQVVAPTAPGVDRRRDRSPASSLVGRASRTSRLLRTGGPPSAGPDPEGGAGSAVAV